MKTYLKDIIANSIKYSFVSHENHSSNTAHKIKFSVNDFVSKREQLNVKNVKN